MSSHKYFTQYNDHASLSSTIILIIAYKVNKLVKLINELFIFSININTSVKYSKEPETG